jgi:hypothetical protein
MRKLSGAIFVNLPADMQAVRDYHAAGGRNALSAEELDQKDQ